MTIRHNGRTMLNAERGTRNAEQGISIQHPASSIVMEDEDGIYNAYREAAERFWTYQVGVYATVKSYNGNQSFALDCAIAAQGLWQLLEVKDFVGLARKYNCTKANVVKLVKKIQRLNRMPPAPGQRELDGCEHMRQARLKQLNWK